MKQFQAGSYQTTNGCAATVAVVKVYGGEWVLRGCVECPQTHALVIASWSMSGRVLSGVRNDGTYDLAAKGAQ